MKNILTNHDLIDKLNNAMDDPESEILSRKYYEPNEGPIYTGQQSCK